ncbi:conserved domain protein [Roseibium sp. TrichSKD4]|nr:conserved domain protein [Roseibium sp. TrichSKD4]
MKKDRFNPAQEALRNCAAFRLLPISVTFKGKHRSQRALPPRNNEPLACGIDTCCIQRIIISFRVDSTQCRRFTRCYSDHLGLPFCTSILAAIQLSLNVSQQIIIIFLQLLMGSSSPCKIKNKLDRSDSSNQGTNINQVDPKLGTQVTHRTGTEDHDKETQHLIEPIEKSQACSVIQRIAQDIEAEIVAIHGHCQSSFGRVASVSTCCPVSVSALGKEAAPATVSCDCFSGCLGPRDLLNIIVGSTASTNFLLMRFTSFCLVQIEVIGAGVRCVAHRLHEYITSNVLLLSKRNEIAHPRDHTGLSFC